ncbi:MAG: Fpg/Nei family DNA glycosylase [Solirubrobacteraceae bacterium]
MPEGDTIHYAANRIRPVLAGIVPDAILAPQARHAHERWAQRLAGAAVASVDAHGKHLFIRFENGLAFHSHLRMTGAWAVPGEGERWRRQPRRAWLRIAVTGVEVVEFDGPVLELARDSRLRVDPRIAGLGQDVIGESFDEERFLRRLADGERDRGIGEALLDQRVLAGIGNVWKSEACFAAALDPFVAVRDVDRERVLAAVAFVRLHMGQSAVLGSHLRPNAVYKRRGLPCPRCGTPIRSEGAGEQNRSTYWCPRCQR